MIVILTILFILYKYGKTILLKLFELYQSYLPKTKETSSRKALPVAPPGHVVRCVHHTSQQIHYARLFQKQATILDFTKSYTITVPVTFYITDVNSVTRDRSNPYIDNTVNQIIRDLNTYFNASYNDGVTVKKFKQFIERVFSDPSVAAARNYYLSKAETMMKSNIKWTFVLKQIIRKPLNLFISGDQSQRDVIADNCPPIGGDAMKELVCVILKSPPGNGILGISSFPFDDINVNKRHQVNISSDIFDGKLPTYNRNMTYAHEFGHFFGLLHVFDNESYLDDSSMQSEGFGSLNIDNNNPQEYEGDLVPDTNPQSDPTYGKISANPNDQYNYANYIKCIQNEGQGGNFYDIMDYSDDDQMFFFTEMQQRRMACTVNCYYPTYLKIN